MKKDKSTGNPIPEVQSNFDRSGGSRALAYAHESLRQHDPNFNGITVRTARNPVTFLGQSAFTSPLGTSDTSTMVPQPDHGRPRVQVHDAAAEAGRYTSMHPTDGYDSGHDHLAGRYDSAPTGSGTNGSHDSSSQQAAVTTPRPAMKNADRIAVIKQEMLRQGII